MNLSDVAHLEAASIDQQLWKALVESYSVHTSSNVRIYGYLILFGIEGGDTHGIPTLLELSALFIGPIPFKLSRSGETTERDGSNQLSVFIVNRSSHRFGIILQVITNR
jgi:hypothetical protein